MKHFRVAFAFLTLALLVTGTAAVAKHRAKHIVYVALGDSFTWGERASKRCDTPAPIPARSCVDGLDYVDDLAHMLDATAPTTYFNAGVSGARMATLLLSEIPHIPHNATLVTIFNGWNDKDAIYNDPSYPFEKWAEELRWVVSAVKMRVPRARIIVATIMNPAYAPHFLPGMPEAYSQTKRTAYAAINERMNASWISLGYEVVDLRCDATLYGQADYSGPEWYHPNDAGYLHIAQRFFDVITHRVPGKPQAECPPYAVAPSPRATPAS